MPKKKKNRTELEREHSADPKANPGNISNDPEPHHSLNNPVRDPDPTADVDPFENPDEEDAKSESG